MNKSRPVFDYGATLTLKELELGFMLAVAMTGNQTLASEACGYSGKNPRWWGSTTNKKYGLMDRYLEPIAKRLGYVNHADFAKRMEHAQKILTQAQRMETVGDMELSEKTPLQILHSIAYSVGHPSQFQATKLLHEMEVVEQQEKEDIELNEDEEIRESFFGLYRVLRNKLQWTPEKMGELIKEHEELLQDFEGRPDIIEVSQETIEQTLGIKVDETK